MTEDIHSFRAPTGWWWRGSPEIKARHFWGRQSPLCSRRFHTWAHSCRVSGFKGGIEMDRPSALLSFSFPFTARLNCCFFKASTWALSFWDYAPNTHSSTFSLCVSPSHCCFFSLTTSMLSNHPSVSLLSFHFTIKKKWTISTVIFSLTCSLLEFFSSLSRILRVKTDQVM